jgi:hypothetical protein
MLTPAEREELSAYEELTERLRRRRLPAMPPALVAKIRTQVAQCTAPLPGHRHAAEQIWLWCRRSAAAALLLWCVTWFVTQQPDPHPPTVTNEPMPVAAARRQEQLDSFIYETTSRIWVTWPGMLTRSAAEENVWDWPQLWPYLSFRKTQNDSADNVNSFSSFEEYFHGTFQHMGNLLYDYAGFAPTKQG